MTLQSDVYPGMGPNTNSFDDEDMLFSFSDLCPGFDSESTKLSLDLADWLPTTSMGIAEVTTDSSPKWKRTEPNNNEIALDGSSKRATNQAEQQHSQQSTQQPRRPKYVRKPQPRAFCRLCPDNKEGFRGDHELRRHCDRVHSTVKKVYVIKDLTDDKRLSRCKACKSKKRYNMDYNATAHLRRQHFNPERDPKVKIPSNLRDWVEVIEVKPTEQERQRWMRTEQREQQNLNASGTPETIDDNWQQYDREIVAMIGQPSGSLLNDAAEAMSTAADVALQTWQSLGSMDDDDLTSFAGEFAFGSFSTASQESFDMQFQTDYSDARLYAASGSVFYPGAADLIAMNTQVMRGGFLPCNADDAS